MRKEKKYFLSHRKKVIRYNKILVGIFALFMLYCLVHSVSILDCKGIDFYTASDVTKEMLSCTNMSTDLLAFFINNNTLICILFLIAAIVVMVLQKINLYKINSIETNELSDEKVNKTTHIIITLLLGYTGLHKYRTQNKIIGNIYLVNFAVFIVSWIVKNFFVETYNNYLMFYCSYKFSLIFVIGIIILNIIEAISSLISLKDDDEKIFA